MIQTTVLIDSFEKEIFEATAKQWLFEIEEIGKEEHYTKFSVKVESPSQLFYFGALVQNRTLQKTI